MENIINYNICLTMTKEELIELNTKNQSMIIESIKSIDKSLWQISNSTKLLNDNNVIHLQLLRRNTNVMDKLVASNNTTMAMIKKVLYLLILAIIVLAGAEKVLKFFTI